MYENIYQGNGRLVRMAKIDKIYIEVHGESQDVRYQHPKAQPLRHKRE